MQAFADALHSGGRIALIDLYAEDGSFHGSAEENAAKATAAATPHNIQTWR